MVATYGSAPMLIIRQEDLSLLEWIDNKHVRACAAALINVLRRACHAFGDREGWIYMPMRQMQAEALGLFGKDSIRKAVDLLIGMGLLARRSNLDCDRCGQLKTYQYKFIEPPLQREDPTLNSGTPTWEVDCAQTDQTLNQISEQTSVTLSQSESRNFSFEQQPTSPQVLLQPPASHEVTANDLSSVPVLVQENQNQILPPWRDKFGLVGYNSSFLEWLRKWMEQISSSPRTIADAVAYVFRCEREKNPVLQVRAEEWLAEQDRENALGEIQAMASEETISDESQSLQRLRQLQAEWRITSPGGRQAIVEQISEHPEWGIKIGDHGPEESEF